MNVASGSLGQRARRIIRQRTFPGSASYWERRYARGGDSGAGSQGEVAQFKARELNAFVRDQGVRSVLEFGSGDGRQLSLAEYPAYVGLDVSPTAIRRCREMYAGDATKRFYLYDGPTWRRRAFRTADLTMSLDVIYHLIEDDAYHLHMEHLFDAAERFVAIFAADDALPDIASHVQHRRFSTWISVNRPQFTLLRRVQNPHISADSVAHLYLYARTDRVFGFSSASDELTPY